MLGLILGSTLMAKSTFLLGLNTPVSFDRYKMASSGIGIVLGWEKKLAAPWRYGVTLSSHGYGYYLNAERLEVLQALTLVPFVNYDLSSSHRMTPFVGVGLGVAYDGIRAGGIRSYQIGEEIPPKPYEGYLAVLTPQVGLHLTQHLDLTLQYNMLVKQRSRTMLSLAYKF